MNIRQLNSTWRYLSLTGITSEVVVPSIDAVAETLPAARPKVAVVAAVVAGVHVPIRTPVVEDPPIDPKYSSFAATSQAVAVLVYCILSK